MTRHHSTFDISGNLDINATGSSGIYWEFDPVFDIDGNFVMNGTGVAGAGIIFDRTPTTTVGGDQTWTGTASGSGLAIRVDGVYTENITGNSTMTGSSVNGHSIHFINIVNSTVGGNVARTGTATGTGSVLGVYHQSQANYNAAGDLIIQGDTAGTNAAVYVAGVSNLTANNIDIDGTTALSTGNAGVQFNNTVTFNATNDLNIDGTAERSHGITFSNNVTSTVGGAATVTGTTNLAGAKAGMYVRGAANTFDGDHTLNGISTNAGNTWAMGTYFENASGTTTIDNGTLTISGVSEGNHTSLGAIELRQANITGSGGVILNGTANGTVPGVNIRNTGTYDAAGGIQINGTADSNDGVRFTNGAAKTFDTDVSIVGNTTSGTYSINMQVNITNNGTLTLDTQSGEGRITGVFSGTGDIVKAGGDAFNLTTAHGYPGTTTVNDGALNVNGTQTNSGTTTVNTPGVYGGVGSAVSSSVMVADGSIRGGTGLGDTGTLNVGSLTFTDASSKLEVNTNGTNAVSVVDVAGSVTLSGMTVDVMEPLAVGTYDLITSTLLLGNAVMGVNNTGNAAYLIQDTGTHTLKLVVAVAGFDVSVVDSITTESGGTGSFTIVMNSKPSADVTVALSSSDTNEGSVQASVTFTSVNWNTPQTVTVTGVDDTPPVGDGSVAYNIVTGNVTSTDTIYGAFDGSEIDDVAMENENNDPPGVSVTVVDAETSESGGTATVQFELLTQPLAGADVTIPLSSSNTAEGTLAVTEITILNANWNNPAANEVIVTGVDDILADGTVVYSIVTGDPTSTDAGHDNLVGSDVSDPSISNTDNDIPGFEIVASDGDTVVSETGTTDDFMVTLNTQPITDVVIDVASSNVAEGAVTPAQLTFTSANWNAPQTVTVTGQDDAVTDGSVDYDVQVTINASSDANYLSVSGQTASATTTDDEVAGFTVSQAAITVDENAGTDTFTVVLDGEPLTAVKINLGSSSTTDATISPSTLTFTPTDWNVGQTVTVTGVANSSSLVDGASTITVAIDPVLSNDVFSSLASQDVEVTVTDVDDTDNDGSRDSSEDAGTNGGDGNGDGTPDSAQQSVSGVLNPATGDYTTVEATGGCTFITENVAFDESSLAVQDANYDYPVGLVDFQVQCPSPGLSTDVTFYYAQDYGTQTDDWVFRKYDGTGTAYADITSLVTFGSHTFTSGPRSGDTVTTVSYTITDGDPLTDEDGVADGVINDPAGPAVEVQSAVAEPLSETGQSIAPVMLVGALVSTAAWYIKGRGKEATSK